MLIIRKTRNCHIVLTVMSILGFPKMVISLKFCVFYCHYTDCQVKKVALQHKYLVCWTTDLAYGPYKTCGHHNKFIYFCSLFVSILLWLWCCTFCTCKKNQIVWILKFWIILLIQNHFTLSANERFNKDGGYIGKNIQKDDSCFIVEGQLYDDDQNTCISFILP